MIPRIVRSWASHWWFFSVMGVFQLVLLNHSVWVGAAVWTVCAGMAAGTIAGKKAPTLVAFAFFLFGAAVCNYLELVGKLQNIASTYRLIHTQLIWLKSAFGISILGFSIGRAAYWLGKKVWRRGFAPWEDDAIRLPPSWVALAAFIGLIFGGSVAGSAVALRIWPYDRVEDVSQELIETELEKAGVETEYVHLVVSSGQNPKTFVAEHVVRGLKLLNDADLASRARLLVKLTASMNDKGCAGNFTGRTDDGQVSSALNQLSSADLYEWCALSGRALVLSLRAPASDLEPSREQVVDAFRTLYGNMSRADVTRLDRDFTALNQNSPLTDAEACWAAKTYFGAVATTSTAARSTLMRLR